MDRYLVVDEIVHSRCIYPRNAIPIMLWSVASTMNVKCFLSTRIVHARGNGQNLSKIYLEIQQERSVHLGPRKCSPILPQLEFVL